MMPNKVKSSFKPLGFLSQSSQNLSNGLLAVANVKVENDNSNAKNSKKPLGEIGNKSGGMLKQKAAKTAAVKSKKDGDKENRAPNGFASAPGKVASADVTAHNTKLDGNRTKERKPKDAPKPFSVMSDAEYEEMFSSVIAASACDTESECDDVTIKTEPQAVPSKKAKVARTPRPRPPPMKVSQLDEAAYDDIFSSAIGASQPDDETPMDVETSADKNETTGTEAGSRNGADPADRDLFDGDSDREGGDPTMDVESDIASEAGDGVPLGDEDECAEGDDVCTPANVFRPRVEMRRPPARVVSKTGNGTKLPGVRRRLMFEGESGADVDSEPTPLPTGDEGERGGPTTLDQSTLVSSTQKSTPATSQGSNTGGHFKLPLVHRTQGKSSSSKGFKAPGSLGQLKAGPMSKAIQIPPNKKPKTSHGQSYTQSSSAKSVAASQSSQRSDTSLSQSQTLSQLDYQLSQPPSHLDARQRLEWLQERRDVGLWVVCDSCDKNRYLPNCKDPLELPDEWYCHMHPDPALRNCAAREVGPTLVEQEDIVHNIYTSGSVVWGRLDGFPWWPAMVDDCPDVEAFYWLNDFSDIPTHYNVTFFDKDSPTRAWLMPSQLQPFTGNEKGRMFKSSAYGENYAARLAVAKTQAMEALALTPAERRKRFSFLARYKGAIGPFRKVSAARVRKELAKIAKSSQPKLSQREISLLQATDEREGSSESERDSQSEQESVSGSEDEQCHKHKHSQKKTKDRKRPSTKQNDSVISKRRKVSKLAGEKSIKKKSDNASLKKSKVVQQKKKIVPERERSIAESAAESSDAEDVQEMPVLEIEGNPNMAAEKTGIVLEEGAANLEQLPESLDEETFFSLAERAKATSARDEERTPLAKKSYEKDPSGPENNKETQSGAESDIEAQSGEENNVEAQSGEENDVEAQSDEENDAEAQSGEENEVEDQPGEKSGDELTEADRPTVQVWSPFSERSNSPSLLSTAGTQDPSQSLSRPDGDGSQCLMSSVVSTSGTQCQRASASSYSEQLTNATDNSWLTSLMSENAVVPNSDPQAELDFSQEMFDAVVPDVGSSSAMSEPYSSEADLV